MSSKDWRELQETLKTEHSQLPTHIFTETECRTPEWVGVHIASRLVNGESLNSICDSLDGITKGMVSWWLVGGQKGGAAGVLAACFGRLREAQAARLGLQAVELIDKMASGEGDFRTTRVALDGSRWMLGRLDGSRWADNQNVKHSGQVTLEGIVQEAEKKRSSLLEKARTRVIEGEAVREVDRQIESSNQADE